MSPLALVRKDSFTPLRAAALALCAGLAAGTAPAMACNGLEARDAWIRPAPPNAAMRAGYVTLVNRGQRPVIVDRYSSPAFADVELHETFLQDGRVRMRPVPPVGLVPGADVTLAPGGKHLMLMQPAMPITEGADVTITLHCGAASKAVAFAVREPQQDK